MKTIYLALATLFLSTTLALAQTNPTLKLLASYHPQPYSSYNQSTQLKAENHTIIKGINPNSSAQVDEQENTTAFVEWGLETHSTYMFSSAVIPIIQKNPNPVTYYIQSKIDNGKWASIKTLTLQGTNTHSIVITKDDIENAKENPKINHNLHFRLYTTKPGSTTLEIAKTIIDIGKVEIWGEEIANLVAQKKTYIVSENGDNCADSTQPLPKQEASHIFSGSCVAYTIAITNHGSEAAKMISLNNNMENMVYKSSHLPEGFTQNLTCENQNCILNIIGKTIPPGDTATIQVRAVFY